MASPWRGFIRFAFHEFYNRFAFTYDAVSQIVSRGEWRAWTRAAIPFGRGDPILELAFGTGNLHLDLYDAGYKPFGVDLSPYMHTLTQKKFRARNLQPRLARADVRALPFPDDFFSSLVMTFPPGFMYDPAAVAELWRVLAPRGALVWVDAAYLYPRDVWSRLLNWALTITGSTETARLRAELLELGGAARWDWRIERIEMPRSAVHVILATKRRPEA